MPQVCDVQQAHIRPRCANRRRRAFRVAQHRHGLQRRDARLRGPLARMHRGRRRRRGERGAVQHGPPGQRARAHARVPTRGYRLDVSVSQQPGWGGGCTAVQDCAVGGAYPCFDPGAGCALPRFSRISWSKFWQTCWRSVVVLAQRYITLQLLCTDDLSLLHTILCMRLQTQIQHCLGPTDTEQFALWAPLQCFL